MKKTNQGKFIKAIAILAAIALVALQPIAQAVYAASSDIVITGIADRSTVYASDFIQLYANSYVGGKVEVIYCIIAGEPNPSSNNEAKASSNYTVNSENSQGRFSFSIGSQWSGKWAKIIAHNTTTGDWSAPVYVKISSSQGSKPQPTAQPTPQPTYSVAAASISYPSYDGQTIDSITVYGGYEYGVDEVRASLRDTTNNSLLFDGKLCQYANYGWSYVLPQLTSGHTYRLAVNTLKYNNGSVAASQWTERTFTVAKKSELEQAMARAEELYLHKFTPQATISQGSRTLQKGVTYHGYPYSMTRTAGMLIPKSGLLYENPTEYKGFDCAQYVGYVIGIGTGYTTESINSLAKSNDRLYYADDRNRVWKGDIFNYGSGANGHVVVVVSDAYQKSDGQWYVTTLEQTGEIAYDNALGMYGFTVKRERTTAKLYDDTRAKTDGHHIRVAAFYPKSAQAPSTPATPTTGINSGSVYTLMHKGSGKYVDITGASTKSGANVELWGGNNSDAQKFTITALSDGSYKLIAKCSGKALDVNGASAKSGANVQQWDWNDSSAQHWYITPCGDGYYKLVAKCSNKVLDVNGNKSASGTNIQQWDDIGSDAQKFLIALAS